MLIVKRMHCAPYHNYICKAPTLSLKLLMFLKDFYWSIAALQCCVSFYCTAKRISYQFSRSLMSNSAISWTAARRLPCPSPPPRACSNSRLWSQWCHPTISFSVIPFSFCVQSFPASGSSPVSQFFASGGHSIGVSNSASVLSMNIQDWFPLG